MPIKEDLIQIMAFALRERYEARWTGGTQKGIAVLSKLTYNL